MAVRSNRGVGLILALIILLILSLLIASMLSAIRLEVWTGDNYLRAIQLVYLAEAGIEDGRESLGHISLPVGAEDFPLFENKSLEDFRSRPVGQYDVALLRADPLTLRSVATIGRARKTIEVQLRKPALPTPEVAITLNEALPPGSGLLGPEFETPSGVEQIVRGVERSATDLYRPLYGESASLGSIGSPSDYRIVVVDGDCVFGNGSGYGVLLVRGDLTFSGDFRWNGLVLVLGQGVLQSAGITTGWISGAVVLTRTRETLRSTANPLGILLAELGEVTMDLPAQSVFIEWSEADIEQAKQSLPYLPATYREY